MLARKLWPVLPCLVLSGCSSSKSTGELISDLKTGQERDRLVAVRLLPERKQDAAVVVPALTQALKDPDSDIRRSAALGLGSFGEQAREAVPALQAAQRDNDARVREAASVALSRIDPARFPASAKGGPKGR